MIRSSHFAILGGAAVLSIAGSTRAAGSAEQCIDANSSAQDAQKSGAFDRARQALQSCMVPSCPQAVRQDCTDRMAELERAQPTVAFSATDEAGADLPDVTVTVDGHGPAIRVNGLHVRVDPGGHEFLFSAPGRVAVSLNATIKEGEHGRAVAATWATTGGVPKAPVPLETTTHRSGVRWVGLGGAFVGVAAAGVGAAFGVLAGNAKAAYQAECGSAIGAPSSSDCTQAGVQKHDDAVSKATVSTALLIGGGVLAAAGAILYFAAPSVTTPVVGIGPGSITLRGSF